MIYVWGYLACGVIVTLCVMWSAHRIDPSPLTDEDDERLLVAVGFVAMMITWPLWLYALMDSRS